MCVDGCLYLDCDPHSITYGDAKISTHSQNGHTSERELLFLFQGLYRLELIKHFIANLYVKIIFGVGTLARKVYVIVLIQLSYSVVRTLK